MEQYDLWTELSAKTKALDHCVRELRASGTAYAQAEKDYKVQLREWCLKMKSDGMAVGLISKICYGIPEVAELRFKRDCAEAVYKANLEAINAIKLEIRIIDNQLGREWGQQ